MIDTAQITTAVFASIDELNEVLPLHRRLEKAVDTVLYDTNGCLDSLELVNLIVITEQNVEDAFGVPVILADERAMSLRHSPFRTVSTFVAYIALALQAQAATVNQPEVQLLRRS